MRTSSGTVGPDGTAVERPATTSKPRPAPPVVVDRGPTEIQWLGDAMVDAYLCGARARMVHPYDVIAPVDFVCTRHRGHEGRHGSAARAWD